MKMNNSTYDLLKWIAQILLPALAALIVGITELWHLPYGALIGGTIMLVDAFLGKILEKSSEQYYGDDNFSMDDGLDD